LGRQWVGDVAAVGIVGRNKEFPVFHDVLIRLVHPQLQDVHRWVITSTLAASPFAVFLATTTASLLAGVEVSTAEMGGSVVVGAIAFAAAACFAVCEELAIGRDVATDPHLSEGGMGSLDMSAELMFSVEAVRLLVAVRAIRFLSRRAMDRCLWDGGNLARGAVFLGNSDFLAFEAGGGCIIFLAQLGRKFSGALHGLIACPPRSPRLLP
jgi:hypothetical protein